MRVVALIVASAALGCSVGSSRNRVADVDSRVQQLGKELNLLRSDPAAYANKLAARRPYYQDRLLKLPGQVPLVTNEGVAALDEAVKALRSSKPLPLLTSSQPLSLAARDHVRDIGPKGSVGHEGSDGSTPRQRMARYAAGLGTSAEVISFGPSDPASVVMDLVVDDGVPSRGHRKILLNGSLRLFGAAFGTHKEFGTMCVIDLADRLSPKK